MRHRTLKADTGMPFTGARGHFSPGWWLPDAPTGKPIAEPARRSDGPPAPETVGSLDSRSRDPTTAANLARLDAALQPRRFSWEGGQ